MKFIKENRNIFLLLMAAFGLRIVLSFFGTLYLDQGTFIAWSANLVSNGFKNFYNSWSDYFPGYLYFLWVLGKLNLFKFVPEVFLYKLPAMLSDLLTGFLIFKILKKSKSQKWGLIGSSLYLFNPAVFANSSLWGQVDSLTSLTSILSIYLLPITYPLSAIVLAFGTLIKPQTAFILPVILFMMLKNKWEYQKILAYLIIGLIVFIGLFVPFWNHGTLASFIFERLSISLNQYPYTSVNAFNFWGLFGFWKSDGFYIQLFGYAFVILAIIFGVWKINKKQKNIEYTLISFIFAATFILFTRMHERHLLPLFAPLVIAAIESPFLLIPYLVFSLTYVLNLYYAYIWITDNFRQIFSDLFIKFFILLNIGALASIYYSIIKNIKFKIKWPELLFYINKFISSNSRKDVKSKFPKFSIAKNKIKYLLLLTLVFAFLTRIFDLNSPPTMYFDEVYHAFTAKTILGPDTAKAWEWWNTPPEGFAYEWTHPPLAKLGMVLGMLVFGQNSFGWRIPQALLGTGCVFLIYLLAKELFKDELVGVFSAAVFSLDGLALVMSRIGMNDSYMLFFVLSSIYFFLKEKDFLSAVLFGLAISSKWSAIWAIPILGVIWLRRLPLKEQPLKVVRMFVWFLVLPFVIYLLSYLPMFLTGHGLDIWWGMQEQMWWYHTGLKATHPYSSMWWTWPFLLRPIYLYTSEEIGGWVSRIYAFGNPFVFWFGFISVVISAIYSYIEKNKNLAFVVFAYLIFFVPWALSPRIMFLYHYLPSIPFLAIATGYVLRRNPRFIFAYLLICLFGFIYFYPHWIGLRIPLWLDSSYYWVKSWR